MTRREWIEDTAVNTTALKGSTPYRRETNPKPKQIKGALGSYAKGCAEEDIVVLCDTTVFGGGKEGILFSMEGLYCNVVNLTVDEKDQTPMPVLYEAIDFMEIEERYIVFHMKNGKVTRAFFSIFTDYVYRVLLKILEGINHPELLKGGEDPEGADGAEAEVKTAAGKEEEAFEELLFGADSMDAEEVLTLGLNLMDEGARLEEEGKWEASEKKGEQAMILMEKAATMGSPEAMYRLGVTYHSFSEYEKTSSPMQSSKDYHLAIKWLREASEAGVEEAKELLEEIE